MTEPRDFTYELRRAGELISTGRLSFDEEIDVGEIVHVAGMTATVAEITWDSTEGMRRLVLEARS